MGYVISRPFRQEVFKFIEWLGTGLIVSLIGWPAKVRFHVVLMCLRMPNCSWSCPRNACVELSDQALERQRFIGCVQPPMGAKAVRNDQRDAPPDLEHVFGGEQFQRKGLYIVKNNGACVLYWHPADISGCFL